MKKKDFNKFIDSLKDEMKKAGLSEDSLNSLIDAANKRVKNTEEYDGETITDIVVDSNDSENQLSIGSYVMVKDIHSVAVTGPYQITEVIKNPQFETKNGMFRLDDKSLHSGRNLRLWTINDVQRKDIIVAYNKKTNEKIIIGFKFLRKDTYVQTYETLNIDAKEFAAFGEFNTDEYYFIPASETDKQLYNDALECMYKNFAVNDYGEGSKLAIVDFLSKYNLPESAYERKVSEFIFSDANSKEQTEDSEESYDDSEDTKEVPGFFTASYVVLNTNPEDRYYVVQGTDTDYFTDNHSIKMENVETGETISVPVESLSEYRTIVPQDLKIGDVVTTYAGNIFIIDRIDSLGGYPIMFGSHTTIRGNFAQNALDTRNHDYDADDICDFATPAQISLLRNQMIEYCWFWNPKTKKAEIKNAISNFKPGKWYICECEDQPSEVHDKYGMSDKSVYELINIDVLNGCKLMLRDQFNNKMEVELDDVRGSLFPWNYTDAELNNILAYKDDRGKNNVFIFRGFSTVKQYGFISRLMKENGPCTENTAYMKAVQLLEMKENYLYYFENFVARNPETNVRPTTYEERVAFVNTVESMNYKFEADGSLINNFIKFQFGDTVVSEDYAVGKVVYATKDGLKIHRYDNGCESYIPFDEGNFRHWSLNYANYDDVIMNMNGTKMIMTGLKYYDRACVLNADVAFTEDGELIGPVQLEHTDGVKFKLLDLDAKMIFHKCCKEYGYIHDTEKNVFKSLVPDEAVSAIEDSCKITKQNAIDLSHKLYKIMNENHKV